MVNVLYSLLIFIVGIDDSNLFRLNDEKITPHDNQYLHGIAILIMVGNI